MVSIGLDVETVAPVDAECEEIAAAAAVVGDGDDDLSVRFESADGRRSSYWANL